MSEFLELSGLSAFVGASYGAQQALSAALEQALVDAAGEQRTALAAGMAPRAVSVYEDETFHPAICPGHWSRCPTSFCWSSLPTTGRPTPGPGR
jgi:hypothetical protein